MLEKNVEKKEYSFKTEEHEYVAPIEENKRSLYLIEHKNGKLIVLPIENEIFMQKVDKAYQKEDEDEAIMQTVEIMKTKRRTVRKKRKASSDLSEGKLKRLFG